MSKILRHGHVLEKDTSMAADILTDELRPLKYDKVTFRIFWDSGSGATDGAVTLEISHDGTVFDTAELSEDLVLVGPTGIHYLTVSVDFLVCRLRYKSTAGGGNLDIQYTAISTGGTP